MIYKNVCYHKGYIYYKNKDDLKYNRKRYVRKYFVRDENGDYSLWRTHEKVKLTSSDDRDNVRMLGEANKAFLYDLPPVQQYLLYTYLNEDRYISESDYRIAFFDIEIQSGRKYPLYHQVRVKTGYKTILELEIDRDYLNTPVYDEEEKIVTPYRRSCYYKAEFPFANLAEYPINLITVYSNIDKAYHTWGLEPYTGDDPSVDHYHYFKTELEMLTNFANWFNKQNFDILTGWNSAHFDVPYVVNRMNQLDSRLSKLLSPLNIAPEIDNENTSANVNYDYSYNCEIPGLIHIDYMVMYRHLTRQFNLPSFKLNDICMKELGIGKIEYDGPIRDFYRKDYNKYVVYNRQDVRCFVKLNDKTGLINTAISLSHNGLILVNKISSMSKLAEAYILQFVLKEKTVPLNKERNVQDWWIQEGYYKNKLADGTIEWQNLIPDSMVKKPSIEQIKKDYLVWVPEKKAYYSYAPFSVKAGFCANKTGLYLHGLDGDINSSYPHHIRQYNISPECVVIKPTPDKIKSLKLIKSKINGVYFLPEEGMIPKFVKTVYAERKYFKKLWLKAKAEKDEVGTIRYFVEQRTRKTIINSVYGALLYPKFRFYNIDCARAITRGARCTIRSLIEATDEFYKSDAILKSANKYLPTIKITFDNGKIDYFYPDDLVEVNGQKVKASILVN
jgi:DNA polymerase elongation subunit (family B)